MNEKTKSTNLQAKQMSLHVRLLELPGVVSSCNGSCSTQTYGFQDRSQKRGKKKQSYHITHDIISYQIIVHENTQIKSKQGEKQAINVRQTRSNRIDRQETCVPFFVVCYLLYFTDLYLGSRGVLGCKVR